VTLSFALKRNSLSAYPDVTLISQDGESPGSDMTHRIHGKGYTFRTRGEPPTATNRKRWRKDYSWFPPKLKGSTMMLRLGFTAWHTRLHESFCCSWSPNNQLPIFFTKILAELVSCWLFPHFMQQYSASVACQTAGDLGNSSTAKQKVAKASSLFLRTSSTKQFPSSLLELSTLLWQICTEAKKWNGPKQSWG